ncbi:hypothetical protein [Streptomyces sp. NBC_00986]|nr:hypothetical protein OG504_34140 [Streptomyces sp. NBC_00986]
MSAPHASVTAPDTARAVLAAVAVAPLPVPAKLALRRPDPATSLREQGGE